jgi:DNA-binding transcriptional LysR family regulator
MLNEINLSRIDLNLLVLFEAVLEERHVARAASRLHVSPSAVSHGLGRLRRLLNDPLFLRQPKGVVPTDRARELAGAIADILDRARRLMVSADVFDPAKSRRRFMIGAPDGASAVLLPALIAEVRATAPGIDLGVRNLVGNFEGSLVALDHRELDAALVPMRELPGRFEARHLYDEDFVLVRRAGNALGRNVTIAAYCAAPHLVVSTSGDPRGPVDDELEHRGKSRRIVLTVSNFLQALAIVAESDLVAALPRHFVAKHGPRYDVVVSEPPFRFLSAPIVAVAPKAALRDAGLAWLLEVIVRSAKHAKMPRAGAAKKG